MLSQLTLKGTDSYLFPFGALQTSDAICPLCKEEKRVIPNTYGLGGSREQPQMSPHPTYLHLWRERYFLFSHWLTGANVKPPTVLDSYIAL